MISFTVIHFILFTFTLTIIECSHDKVLLTDVKTLTLRRNEFTKGRRSAPIPQIRCIGGEAMGEYEPRVVQCYNRGYDGIDVQWECKADLRDQYEFGNIRISCEGYDYPKDPYILQGSCGLEYELEYTQESGKKQGKPSKKTPSAPYLPERKEFGFGSLITLGLVCLFIYIVYSSFPSTPDSGRTRRSGFGWFDGGPPPPPGSGPPPPGFKSYSRPAGAPPTYEESCRSGAQGAQSGTQSSGPGFFSGLGLGGLAGYLYARSQNSGNNEFRQRGSSSYGSSSGFWGTSHAEDDSSRPSTSRVASGFGGTVRR